MGGGNFDSTSYNSARATRRATGVDDFAWSKTMASAPPSARRAHESLDPLSVNNAGAHANQNIRESLDSDEHPNSQAIAVLFDNTSSMGGIPVVLQSKLADLFALLLTKGYVEDPQILVGAINDAWMRSAAPLQVSQFESDNRVDEALRNIYLEGGGGGNRFESYLLGMYYMAHHTYIDCWEQRGQKGFLFLIGDETCEKTLSRDHIKQWVGDDVEADVPVEDVLAALEEKWHVFFLFPTRGSYPASMTLDGDNAPHGATGWRPLLGERAMVLDDADAVCEVIALTVGMELGTVTLDDAADHLSDLGRDPSLIQSVSKTLVLAGVGSGGSGGIVPLGTSDGDLDIPADDGGVDRL